MIGIRFWIDNDIPPSVCPVIVYVCPQMNYTAWFKLGGGDNVNKTRPVYEYLLRLEIFIMGNWVWLKIETDRLSFGVKILRL